MLHDNRLTEESSEATIWTAVLSQAIADLTYRDPVHPDIAAIIRDKARLWFAADRRPRILYDKGSRWDGGGCDREIGSFEWICQVIGRIG